MCNIMNILSKFKGIIVFCIIIFLIGIVSILMVKNSKLNKMLLSEMNKETAKKSTSIIKDLKNNDLGIEDICEKYSLKRYQVLNINKGKTYRDDNESYPIREVFLPKETRLKIIDLLKNTDLYYKEIAEITGTNISEVSNINSGKVWFDKNINYPIRNSTCDK